MEEWLRLNSSFLIRQVFLVILVSSLFPMEQVKGQRQDRLQEIYFIKEIQVDSSIKVILNRRRWELKIVNRSSNTPSESEQVFDYMSPFSTSAPTDLTSKSDTNQHYQTLLHTLKYTLTSNERPLYANSDKKKATLIDADQVLIFLILEQRMWSKKKKPRLIAAPAFHLPTE